MDILEVPESKSVEKDSKESLIFAQKLLLGESVYLRFDGLDQINLEIVRQGYGRVYTQSPFRHMELFAYYESRARE